MKNTAINLSIENCLILKIQNDRKNFHQDIINNNNRKRAQEIFCTLLIIYSIVWKRKENKKKLQTMIIFLVT